jgi:hypothetical protein
VLIPSWPTTGSAAGAISEPRPWGNATAGGYTLLLISAANAINASMFDMLNFNFTSPP